MTGNAKMKKRIGWLAVLLTVASCALAQPLSKDSFETESFRIYYPVNKIEIQENYMGNAVTLDHIKRYLQSSPEISNIVIYSYASPEGPWRWNDYLARHRGVEAKEFLLANLPEGRILADSVIKLMPETENWEGLRMEVEESYHRPDRATVLLILDDPNIDTSRKKELLQQLDHGRSWHWIVVNIMPRLRYATWITVWRPIPAEVAPVTATEIKVPEQPEALPELTLVEQPLREPMLSVKTNLLYDLFTMPDFGFAPILNVRVEYYPRNSRWTVVGEYDFPWWKRDSRHDYFQILNWQLETRRYFRHDGTHTGHYLSGYAMVGIYDISLDAERGWQGEGGSLGLGYGYAMPLGSKGRWKLDFHVQLGYYYGRYDPYHAGDPYLGKYYYDWDKPIERFKRRNHTLNYFGPTGVGVTLSYDLLRRKSRTKMLQTVQMSQP